MNSAIHPECYAFVEAVEELLQRRQAEKQLADGMPRLWQQDTWGPRSWHRTELEDMVYSSYKRMRQGHITRPPRRQTVMEIADYLNCTLEERNRLLIAAHSAPVAPYFMGERLQELLQVTAEVARLLTVPAMIINRDWRIHFFNQPMQILQRITPEQIAAIPPERLNFLRLLFDPELPLYPRISKNPASWLRMARQSIYGFKMANQLCQFEDWYQTLVGQLVALPEFLQHWESVLVDAPFSEDFSVQQLPSSVTVDTTLEVADSVVRRVWLRPLVISAGYFQFDFPQIVAFLPADRDSRDAFIELGLPVGDDLPSLIASIAPRG